MRPLPSVPCHLAHLSLLVAGVLANTHLRGFVAERAFAPGEGSYPSERSCERSIQEQHTTDPDHHLQKSPSWVMCTHPLCMYAVPVGRGARKAFAALACSACLCR